MDTNQRRLLFEIHNLIKKLSTPPPPTFSPQTGETTQPQPPKAAITGEYTQIPLKTQR